MLIWGTCTNCNSRISIKDRRRPAGQLEQANLCDHCQRRAECPAIIDSIGGLMFITFMLVIALKVAINIIVP